MERFNQTKQPFTEVSSLNSLATYFLRDSNGMILNSFANVTNLDYTILHSTIINAYHNPRKFQKELIEEIENNNEFLRLEWFLTQLKNNEHYIEEVKNQAIQRLEIDITQRERVRNLDYLFIMFLWMCVWH